MHQSGPRHAHPSSVPRNPVPTPSPPLLPTDLLTGGAPRAARLLSIALLTPLAHREPALQPLLDRLGDGAAELEGDPSALMTLLDEAASLVAARSRSGSETERKYLLRALPEEARNAPWRDIAQGYIPGVELVERLRVVTTPDSRVRRYRTVKLGTGITRVEVEEEVSAELFDPLWALTAGRRVSKRRYLVREGDLAWEVDLFHGRDLVLAEVELEDSDAVVELPSWLSPHVVREVTGEDQYVNLNLAK